MWDWSSAMLDYPQRHLSDVRFTFTKGIGIALILGIH